MERPKRARSRKRRKQPREDLQPDLFSENRGSHCGGNDALVTGREKSDALVVPQGRRKSAPTAVATRGGKEGTASKERDQLAMFARPTEGSLRATTVLDSSAMSMEVIADQRNLLRAFDAVAANRGAPGPDEESIEFVKDKLARLIPALSQTLLDGTYCPGVVRRVWIPKPGGKRGLGIPNVVDRLVQQAVSQVLSPQFETVFHDSSHGFRPQRSCHSALAEAKAHLESGAAWVVDIDLEKFFDRVHHQRLLARLERRGVQDVRVLRLIGRMLKASVVMPGGVVVSTDEGTPQGGPLSPLLSNIVLDELDWELHRRGLHFVRYADDCNIYVRTERAGKRVMASVRRFIERKLRLSVNDEKSAVARPRNCHFVGFSLNRRRDGVRVQMSKRTRQRLWAKIRSLTPRTWGRSLSDCIARINGYVAGWVSFFGICSKQERRLLRRVDAHIRRRLRTILIRQRGRKRFVVRWFIKLGVKAREAWRDIYGGNKGPWAMSATPAAHGALGINYFREAGLLELYQLWEQQRDMRRRFGALAPK